MRQMHASKSAQEKSVEQDYWTFSVKEAPDITALVERDGVRY